MKAFIVALAFGVALPVSAFAQDAPPFVTAIAPQAAVSPACVGRQNQAVNRPRRRSANSMPILYLRSHTGGQACWGDRRSDQGGYRCVGAGAKNEH
jgi:hypothetical protein